MELYFVILILFVTLTIIYILLYFYISKKFYGVESIITNIFIQKVSKIPAVIEVMRPYVVDEKKAFDYITGLHSQSLVRDYSSIYMLLEHNARVQDQYAFLMRLSMAIPELQKNDYFIYIRDFVISYERMMRAKFGQYNSVVKKWNMFVSIKNITVIGLILPGKKQIEI